uniref:Uncharacterized protein n=1 Tax=Anguilla anguilla TaxID=7936 RepID=A0A0E9WKM9_ANGAN
MKNLLHLCRLSRIKMNSSAGVIMLHYDYAALIQGELSGHMLPLDLLSMFSGGQYRLSSFLHAH